MLKPLQLILILGTIVSFISSGKTEPTDKKNRLKYTNVSGDTTTKYIYNERGDISGNRKLAWLNQKILL